MARARSGPSAALAAEEAPNGSAPLGGGEASLKPGPRPVPADDAPEIEETRPRGWRRALAWLFGLVVLILGATVVVDHLPVEEKAGAPAAQQAAPVPVTVADVTTHDVPVYLDGLGTVQASNTVAIRTQVDGKLQSVNFVEGQHVKKGDVLAIVDPRPFQAALDQVKAKKAQDQAQLVSDEKDLARFKDLVGKGAGTQQAVDQQQAKVDALKATIDADEAAIESAETQLSYATITAPIDGRIGIRQVDAGNIVHAADQTPVTVLTDLTPAMVIFTLPQRDLADGAEPR